MYVQLMVMRICGPSHPGVDQYLAYIARSGAFVCLFLEICVKKVLTRNTSLVQLRTYNIRIEFSKQIVSF